MYLKMEKFVVGLGGQLLPVRTLLGSVEILLNPKNGKIEQI